MTGYAHGEPVRKIDEMRAAVAAKELTEEEAIDALFAWAQRVGWQITRASAEKEVKGNRKIVRTDIWRYR